jgi:hypothetical protein
MPSKADVKLGGGIASGDFVHHPFRACTNVARLDPPKAPPRCGRRLPASLPPRSGSVAGRASSPGLVSLGKLGSWDLLLVISYAMVALINRPQPFKGEPREIIPGPTSDASR